LRCVLCVVFLSRGRCWRLALLLICLEHLLSRGRFWWTLLPGARLSVWLLFFAGVDDRWCGGSPTPRVWLGEEALTQGAHVHALEVIWPPAGPRARGRRGLLGCCCLLLEALP
jgi:hypothetical protein